MSERASDTHEIARVIAAALGLPKNTRRFTLRAGFDIATTVEVEYYVKQVEAGSFPELKKEIWTIRNADKKDHADGN